jgi:proprotein convertase subtilisin/kexin type 2
VNFKCFKLVKLMALILLAFSSPVWAADSYNPANNELTIESVLVEDTVYTNVVITVGAVLQVNGGASNGSMDIYNAPTNQLSIPSVFVNGTNYTNVVISVGQVLRVGGAAPYNGSSTDSATTNSSSVLVTTFISIN